MSIDKEAIYGHLSYIRQTLMKHTGSGCGIDIIEEQMHELLEGKLTYSKVEDEAFIQLCKNRAMNNPWPHDEQWLWRATRLINLIELESKIPKGADGMPVYPDKVMYVPHLGLDEVFKGRVVQCWTQIDSWKNGECYTFPVQCGYSTLKAAQKALE